MTDLDPYAELGLDKNASQADVRKAYRKRSKDAHPDTGGSEAEFGRIATALAVLSDPKRRDHYDKTGKIEDIGPDNTDQQAWAIISQMMDEIVGQAEHPQRVDIPGTMHTAMQKGVAKYRAALIVLDNKRAGVRKLEGRWKRKARKAAKKGEPPGPNMMENLLRASLVAIERQEQPIKDELAKVTRALELLGEYDFDREARQDDPWAGAPYKSAFFVR